MPGPVTVEVYDSEEIHPGGSTSVVRSALGALSPRKLAARPCLALPLQPGESRPLTVRPGQAIQLTMADGAVASGMLLAPVFPAQGPPSPSTDALAADGRGTPAFQSIRSKLPSIPGSGEALEVPMARQGRPPEAQAMVYTRLAGGSRHLAFHFRAAVANETDFAAVLLSEAAMAPVATLAPAALGLPGLAALVWNPDDEPLFQPLILELREVNGGRSWRSKPFAPTAEDGSVQLRLNPVEQTRGAAAESLLLSVVLSTSVSHPAAAVLRHRAVLLSILPALAITNALEAPELLLVRPSGPLAGGLVEVESGSSWSTCATGEPLADLGIISADTGSTLMPRSQSSLAQLLASTAAEVGALIELASADGAERRWLSVVPRRPRGQLHVIVREAAVAHVAVRNQSEVAVEVALGDQAEGAVVALVRPGAETALLLPELLADRMAAAPVLTAGPLPPSFSSGQLRHSNSDTGEVEAAGGGGERLFLDTTAGPSSSPSSSRGDVSGATADGHSWSADSGVPAIRLLLRAQGQEAWGTLAVPVGGQKSVPEARATVTDESVAVAGAGSASLYLVGPSTLVVIAPGAKGRSLLRPHGLAVRISAASFVLSLWEEEDEDATGAGKGAPSQQACRCEFAALESRGLEAALWRRPGRFTPGGSRDWDIRLGRPPGGMGLGVGSCTRMLVHRPSCPHGPVQMPPRSSCCTLA